MAKAYMSVVLLIVCTGLLANGDDNNSSLGEKCGAEFQKVAACLTYATGKAPSPSKECCDAAADIKDKDPVCLCYIIEQIHKGSSPQLKSMGIQEDKLLQLPSACKLTNASISNCPRNTGAIGSWEEELSWADDKAKRKTVRCEIAGCVFCMTVAIIWRERNQLRFQAGIYQEEKICKEIATHVHIKGRNRGKWQMQYHNSWMLDSNVTVNCVSVIAD